MCLITIIAARSQNNVIGNGNLLPWRLPSDLKQFRSLTQNSVIIMGRKTYESIGKPLPNRQNIVISSNNAIKYPEGVIVCTSPKEALKTARVVCLDNKIPEIFVIGGATIYQAFIKRADRMILTTLDCELEGDTFFPQWKEVFWEIEKTTECYDPEGYLLDKPENKGIRYTIEEYERVL